MNILKLFFKKWKQGFQWRKFKDNISNPPWNYYFLQNLSEKEYPKYLKKIFENETGEKLDLKHPKTFNQKIQWIKLYGVTPLMRDCTDKVKVRDYVKEKIGEEYLKPVLQIIPNESHETVRCHCEQVNDNSGLARQSRNISHDTLDCHADIKMSLSARLRFPKFQFRENRVLAEYNDGEPNAVSAYFDKINFEKLPNCFVIKTNHGCKWHYIIKDKEAYLKNKRLFDITKKRMTGWLEQDYSFWCGFEMNYHNIEPKILIEPLMREDINISSDSVHVYCFSGIPKIFIRFFNENKMSIWNEKFEPMENIFGFSEENIKLPVSGIIKQTFVLSKRLSKSFNFVRVDWLIYKNKPYFEELTFTPYSGLNGNLNALYNKKLGEFINLKGE